MLAFTFKETMAVKAAVEARGDDFWTWCQAINARRKVYDTQSIRRLFLAPLQPGYYETD